MAFSSLSCDVVSLALLLGSAGAATGPLSHLFLPAITNAAFQTRSRPEISGSDVLTGLIIVAGTL